jgi:hypothetical protein
VTTALGLKPPAGRTAPYEDVDSASPVGRAAAALVQHCPQDGLPILDGVAPRLFASDAPITRGEAARLLQRAFLPIDVPRRLVRPRE